MSTALLMIKSSPWVLGVCALFCVVAVAHAAPTTGPTTSPSAAPSPADLLPPRTELPDPFLFDDGSTRVKTKDDWNRRRAELRELIQRLEYGHLPPVPAKGAVTAVEEASYEPPKPSGSNAGPRSRPTTKPSTGPAAAEPTEVKLDLPPGTVEKRLLLTVAAPAGKSVAFHVILTVPPGKGPFPAIVRGDLNWGRVKPAIYNEVARRGYLLAEFDRTEIVPDKKGERAGAAYDVYPDQDFAALAAWAWGFHRTIDYLETRPDVDAKKIAVTGHSRGGKAVLLAGATDDRIALTNPNNSGCGGAGSYHHQAPKSEDLAAILKNFPYWFSPNIRPFIGKQDRLPLDQHFVKAVVAPRALLTTEALGDVWANPEGTQVTHTAAKEVYDFLGAGDKIAVYYRPGPHQHNPDDWRVLLDYADKVFLGKDAGRKFNELPFKDAPKKYAWSSPGKEAAGR